MKFRRRCKGEDLDASVRDRIARRKLLMLTDFAVCCGDSTEKWETEKKDLFVLHFSVFSLDREEGLPRNPLASGN